MTDDTEQRVRDGLAELVRTKPDLGRIDVAAVVARRAGRSGSASVTRWLAVAAVAVIVAALGLGLWFGVVRGGEPQVVTAQPSVPATPLVGTSWLVTQITVNEAVVDSRGHVPSLRLTADQLVTVTDPCNQIRGSYRIDGERLTFTGFTSSDMACGQIRQQARYRAGLEDVTRFTLQGSTLTLFNAADRPILVFRAAADPSPPPSTTVQVRVRNDSDVDFEKVMVTFGKGRVDYGPIAAGRVSDYRRAGVAYNYAAIRATVGGNVLAGDIFDYTGETPLPPGRYTYVLTAGSGSLDLRFEADQ